MSMLEGAQTKHWWEIFALGCDTPLFLTEEWRNIRNTPWPRVSRTLVTCHCHHFWSMQVTALFVLLWYFSINTSTCFDLILELNTKCSVYKQLFFWIQQNSLSFLLYFAAWKCIFLLWYFFEYLGSWGMTSLWTETGETLCTKFFNVVKIWGKNRFFQLMIALEESGIPKTSPLPQAWLSKQGRRWLSFRKWSIARMMWIYSK